jgi:RNA methyltransferase, TrmH family
MLSKNEIKDIQSLRHKKQREETRLFIAEGPKIIAELLTIIPHLFKKVYALANWVNEHKNLLAQTDFEIISESELEKLSQLQTPNQAVGVLHQFESIEPIAKNSITLYLDTVQDPGNFGSIIRIADWFGIKNIVCTDGCADLYNIKVVQATMASISRVNVFYDEEQNWLKQQTVNKYAATLNGNSLYQIGKIEEGILIIGNESKGIQPSIMELASEKITIPKIGHAESLNAAVATGIILSHLLAGN